MDGGNDGFGQWGADGPFPFDDRDRHDRVCGSGPADLSCSCSVLACFSRWLLFIFQAVVTSYFAIGRSGEELPDGNLACLDSERSGCRSRDWLAAHPPANEYWCSARTSAIQ